MHNTSFLNLTHSVRASMSQAMSETKRIAKELPSLLAIAAMMSLLAGCKTTVKNYQAAYDVAIGKQQREEQRKAELQKEMGMDPAIIQEVDGVKLETISGQEVMTLHASFARADSVSDFSVSVANFKMPTNADSMAADLRAEGWKEAKAAKSGEKYYVLIGSDKKATPMLNLMESYVKKNPERATVGQPGVILVIGGSPR